MKYILILPILLLMVSGCSSLNWAGASSYQLRQVTDENGKAGFDISVKNGKEIAAVDVHLEKDGEKVIIDLKETGVAAFAGQKISADALKLTVEQAVKAAVAVAIAGVAPEVLPLAGAAIASGALPAVAAGAGGALLLDKTLSKPAAPVSP